MLPLRDLVWLVACAMGASAAASFAGGFLVRRLAPRWGLLDYPGGRKTHGKATPLGGGLAILAGVVLPLALGHLALMLLRTGAETPAAERWLAAPAFVEPHLAGLWQQMPKLWKLVGAAAVLAGLGLADDRWRLDWRLRLLVQFAVAAWCVYGQKWGFTVFLAMPGLTNLLSVLWIVVLVNAFNMLDNMDGLAGGVALVIAGSLAAIVLSPQLEREGPQLFVAGWLLVLAGSLLGFLWHNRPPARLFMGDAGSYFVGFALALATILATYTQYDSDSRHTLLAPLCVMAVPLYDMASVIGIRLWQGRSPFQGDRSHFSHRLTDLGLSRTQAVLTVLLTTATCCLAALLLPRVDTLGAILIVLLVACVLVLVAILELAARRKTQIK